MRPARPLADEPVEDDAAVPVAASPQAAIALAPRSIVARPKVGGSELDATWEKRLRDGLATPDRTVDLHGLTAAEAHRRALAAIEGAHASGARLILLITGKAPRAGTSRLDQPMRGVIRASLADWIAASPARAHVVTVRAAHRRHGGDGAVYVILRRQRRTKD